jgi:hypothetical protein
MKPVVIVLSRERGRRGSEDGGEPNQGTLDTYMEMSQ